MVRSDWVVGGDRHAAAAERIYAAATDLVLREVSTPWTSTRWPRPCTVPGRPSTATRVAKQIRDAVLMRLSAGIIGAVRDAVDGLVGRQRIVTAISVALEQIRSERLRRLMFASRVPQVGGLHSSPVLSRLAADLTGITDDDPHAAQWIVRVVVSLAYWPIDDPRDEEEAIRRFVAPAFG